MSGVIQALESRGWESELRQQRARLAIAMPGCMLVQRTDTKGQECYRVHRYDYVLSEAATPREAVDRCLFLWGRQ